MGDPGSKQQTAGDRRLESWKEIAAYLGRDARTARRWEQTEGLPVHRHQHAKLASVYAFTSEIDAWRDARTTRPGDPPRRRWGWIAAAAGIAIAGALLVLWKPDAPGVPQFPRPITSSVGDETIPALSPGGQQVAFSWNGEKQDNYDIYIQAADGGGPLRLTRDPRLDTSPVFSPDGRSIAFVRGGAEGSEVIVVPAQGGAERIVAHLRLKPGRPEPILDWSPDGKWIVSEDSDPVGYSPGLFAIALEGGARRRLTSPGHDEADFSPAFSPDGGSLLFVRGTGNAVSGIRLLALDAGMRPAGSVRRLNYAGFENVLIERPQWVSAGSLVFSSTRGGSSRLWRAPADGSGVPQFVSAAGEHARFATVKAGRLAFARLYSRRSIWRAGPDGAGPVIASTRSDENPQLSPDGSRIAFESWRSGTMEIWIAGRDGSNPVRLTHINGPVTGSPRWSPDGASIAFDSRFEGGPQVYRIPAAGGAPVRITNPPANNLVPAWSRDGRWLYFASRRSGRYEVWRRPAGGGPENRVTANGGFSACESPDGRFLYYTKTPDSPAVLARMPLGGGAEEIVAPAIVDRAFVPTARGVFYIPLPAVSIVFLDASTRRAAPVATLDGAVSTGLSVSADGRTILYSRKEADSHDIMLVDGIR